MVKNKKTSEKSEAFKWFLQESNQGHMDFQSIALPTELRNHYVVVYYFVVLKCCKSITFCNITQVFMGVFLKNN